MLDKRRAAYLQILRRMARPAKVPRPLKAQAIQFADVVVDEVVVEKPANQGARWTETDDQLLRDAWHSPEAPTLKQVAERFARNEGGIAARLVKQGIFPDREAARQESESRQLARLPPLAGGEQ